MELPNVLNKITSKEDDQEQFIAVEIGSETVTTAIWQIVDGKTKIVNVGSTEERETSGEENGILTAIDSSLSKAMEGMETEPNKVIFGLQESWVEGDSLTKQHSKILKQICEKFEFEPIGFVVTNEAIIQQLKIKEGTPPTTILIRVNEADITVAIVNLGKIIGNETVARSEDIGADVEEGLARLDTKENLPSQMLLFNTNHDLEKLKQDLLSYNWLEKLPFLHFPTVQILEKQMSISSVAIAGGAEAAKALGFEITEEEKEETKDEEKKVKKTTDKTKETKKPLEEEEKQESLEGGAAIGFQMHTDVAQKKAKEEVPQEKASIVKTDEFEAKKDEIDETTLDEKEPRKEPKSLSGIKRLTSLFGKFSLPTIPSLSLKDGFASRTKVAIASIIGFVILLTALAAYAYWAIPRADITLYVRPRKLEKELTIIIDPSGEQESFEQNVVSGKIVESQVQGSKEKETTGERTVGEKATGEVTIYNKTSKEKTFPAGTTIIGMDNLEFTLDTEVSVASASAEETDEAVTTTYGKTKVSVTAAAIGAEYNFNSDVDFKFESFSQASYSAKNDAEFTGGTSRQVQAISQEDIDTLTEELTEELKQQAAEELEEQEGGGKKVLKEGAKAEVTKQELSGEVGDETQTVSLTLSLNVTSIAYNESDFGNILREAVQDAVPDDFEFQQEESTTEIRSVDFSEDKAEITLLFTAILTPKIDKEELKRELSGKYPRVVEEHLKSLPNLTKAEVQITPKALPARLKTFPRKLENISIEIKIEE